jgi:hypothetical protein
MFQTIDINIYGSTIRVQSEKTQCLEILKKEFRYFLSESDTNPRYLLTLHHAAAPAGVMPKLIANRVSQNSLTYDEGPRRWNDYFGKALSCYDYEMQEGVLYAENEDVLHEIAYLMILSLTGKELDQHGRHKIHACAFRYRGIDAIVMLPSKGGKTTLFLELAQHPGVSLISDDTPLIDEQGHVHPFPLRLGVEVIPDFLQARAKNFSLFRRQNFSDKWLIGLDELGAPLALEAGARARLFIGMRHNDLVPAFVPASTLQTSRALMEHMVIGIGLPIVLEYFVRHTWSDWWQLAKIGVRRMGAAWRLQNKGRAHYFLMGKNPTLNAEALLKHLEQNP